MAYRRYKKKARRYAKKASRAGFRKMNKGYMARSGKRAPMSSRGWKNIVKGAKPELKYFDKVFQNESGADVAGATMLAGGWDAVPAENQRITLLCNNVAQGQDFTSRIGRKILIKSVYTRMTFYPRTNNTLPSQNSVRAMLIWDLQPNNSATLPLLSEFFETLTLTPTQLMNTTVMMNLNWRERFVILWDKMFTLGFLAGTAANGNSCRVLKKYKKVNLSVTYSGTGSGTNNRPGEIATGALYLVVLGDAPGTGTTLAGDVIQCKGVNRIRFTDA